MPSVPHWQLKRKLLPPAQHPEQGFVLCPRASERRVLPIVGVCISSSHLHTFSSSHLLSHLLIFTSAHLHICSSSDLLSHLLIFTSAHLYIISHIFSHICSSSHLLIFTSSLTSSLTSAHLHICSSSHLLSHLLIFTSAHLHTFSHIFSSSHLLSFLSPFSRPRVVPAGSHETWTLLHEMRVDCQKLR